MHELSSFHILYFLYQAQKKISDRLGVSVKLNGSIFTLDKKVYSLKIFTIRLSVAKISIFKL
jgi:hypothetical protein